MISSATRPRTGAGPAVPRRDAPPGSVVPFEYAAAFELTGRPGNAVQDVVTLAPDGPFVAVAIGYGFEEERGRPFPLPAHDGAAEDRSFRPSELALGDVPAPALIQGVRVHPDSHAILFTNPAVPPGGTARNLDFSEQRVQERFLGSHFQTVKPPEEIAFLLSLTDSATGREFQDVPVHNLASLGSSDGRRPFRLLAHPVTFQPRSTVRFLVSERSPGVKGTLFVVLFGFMALGSTACPAPPPRLPRGRAATALADPFGAAPSRVIPFDYVASFLLEGKPGRTVEDEIAVNVEGGFVATSVGYGLEVPEHGVRLRPSAEPGAIEGLVLDAVRQPVGGTRVTARSNGIRAEATTGPDGRFRLARLRAGNYEILAADSTDAPRARVRPGLTTLAEFGVPAAGRFAVANEGLDLNAVPLRAFPPDALLDGFRIRPSFLRIAFQDDGRLTRSLPLDLADEIFERINRPEEVSFRYSVFDGGRGRDLQNRAIHNVAGLGIADGDRPFKQFARPLVFLPRSTLRVTVEERLGRGNLFMAFQGYKLLGGPPPGGRR